MARTIVTGARRGIGREIALSLARRGHAVVATMRRTDGCDLIDIAHRENLSIVVAELDVDDDASVARFFATPAADSEPIDVLINNASEMAVENLPSPRADSAYPHGRRMLAFYADTGVSGTPASIVAETVLDIVDGRIASFRTLTGPDAAPFLALRNSLTDEAWIALSDTLDDGVFFQRFGASSGAG